jgi:hypothetical protein
LQKKEPSAPEQNPDISPNLLESYKSDFVFSIDFIRKTTFILKIFILIFPMVFLFSLFLNDIEDKRLSQAENTQSILENELLSYRGLESSAARVIGKTEVYKEAKASFASVSKPLDIILTRIPKNVFLDTAEFSSNKVTLVVRSPTALGFPILISNYFQEKSVSEITLTSAELDVVKQQFVMKLDVLFK